jgi:hypothetical protein
VAVSNAGAFTWRSLPYQTRHPHHQLCASSALDRPNGETKKARQTLQGRNGPTVRRRRIAEVASQCPLRTHRCELIGGGLKPLAGAWNESTATAESLGGTGLTAERFDRPTVRLQRRARPKRRPLKRIHGRGGVVVRYFNDWTVRPVQRGSKCSGVTGAAACKQAAPMHLRRRRRLYAARV